MDICDITSVQRALAKTPSCEIIEFKIAYIFFQRVERGFMPLIPWPPKSPGGGLKSLKLVGWESGARQV
jgi:hypothetical protein